MRGRRRRQLVAAAALVIGVIVGWPAIADAHANLLSSDPADGATLATAPTVAHLTFSEPVDPTLTHVAIRGVGNTSTPPRKLSNDAGHANVLDVTMPDLKRGSYAISWRTTTTDGHTASGDVLFAVGGAGPSGIRRSAAVSTGTGWLGLAATGGRVLWYIAFCLVAGGLLWSRAMARPPINDASGGVIDRWWKAGLRLGAGTLAVLTVARLAVLVATLHHAAPAAGLGTIVRHLLATLSGKAWVGLLVAALMLAVPRMRRQLAPAASLVVVVAACEALTGHTAAAPNVPLAAASMTVHLVAFSAWLGGLALLAGLLRSSQWRALPNHVSRPAAIELVRRFSPVAMVAVAALLLTGVLNAQIQLGHIRALTGSGYGHTLLIKLALVAVALPFGAWHWRSGRTARTAGHVRELGARLLAATTMAETAAIVAVVVLASILASRAPARGVAATPSVNALAANATVTDCRKAPIETSTCWERTLAATVDRQGERAAIADLTSAMATDALVKNDCHQLIHSVGRESFRKERSVPAALKYTTELCASGYQHGVLEAAIADLDSAQLASAIPTFCTPITFRRYSLDHYNCVHGIGHGIATHLNEDVFASLPYCKVLNDAWEQTSCEGGVFMQRVIGDINQPPPDDHRGDPVWPCDVVDSTSKGACYQIATGRVLRLNNYDFKNGFQVCDQVEAGWVQTCYESMGRDISGYASLDPNESYALCQLAGSLGPIPCIDGAVRNAVYDQHSTPKATALCNLLGQADRPHCYSVRDELVAQF